MRKFLLAVARLLLLLRFTLGTCIFGDVCPEEETPFLLQTSAVGRVRLLDTRSAKARPRPRVMKIEGGNEQILYAEQNEPPLRCEARLERFELLHNQDLLEDVGWDPFFPPDMSSIAEDGAVCGDPLSGTNETCEDFNNWKTFQDVANASGSNFSVIGPSGPRLNDLHEGKLGTCYFVAALASLAHTHPKMIENAFVDRDLWSENVFRTRWFINGRGSNIVVDNSVPASDSNKFFFTQTSSTGEFWPVILEKAWAKAFTSYHAAEDGQWQEVIAGLTRAPVHSLRHAPHAKQRAPDFSKDEIWDVLDSAHRANFPIGAESAYAATKYGIAASHAYSVLDVKTDDKYGRLVQCFKSWPDDKYSGEVPDEDETDFTFWMTIDEYYDAFRETVYAEVKDSYETAFQEVPSFTMAAMEVSVPEAADPEAADPEFFVSLTWPSFRFVHPCTVSGPKITLVVSSKDDLPSSTQATIPASGSFISSATVRKTSGPGNYTAIAFVSFAELSFIDHMYLNSYSAYPAATMTRLAGGSYYATELAMAMLGPTDENGDPCSIFTYQGYGAFTRRDMTQVFGLPTFWSLDSTDLLYFPTSSQGGVWYMVGISSIKDVQMGSWYKYSDNHGGTAVKSNFHCGCRDDPAGLTMFEPRIMCPEAVTGRSKVHNVHCNAPIYGNLVRRYCPETCQVTECGFRRPSTTTLDPSDLDCVDQDPTSIVIGDAEVPATCEELAPYCAAYSFVRDQCCKTCS